MAYHFQFSPEFRQRAGEFADKFTQAIEETPTRQFESVDEALFALGKGNDKDPSAPNLPRVQVSWIRDALRNIAVGKDAVDYADAGHQLSVLLYPSDNQAYATFIRAHADSLMAEMGKAAYTNAIADGLDRTSSGYCIIVKKPFAAACRAMSQKLKAIAADAHRSLPLPSTDEQQQLEILNDPARWGETLQTMFALIKQCDECTETLNRLGKKKYYFPSTVRAYWDLERLHSHGADLKKKGYPELAGFLEENRHVLHELQRKAQHAAVAQIGGHHGWVVGIGREQVPPGPPTP